MPPASCLCIGCTRSIMLRQQNQYTGIVQAGKIPGQPPHIRCRRQARRPPQELMCHHTDPDFSINDVDMYNAAVPTTRTISTNVHHCIMLLLRIDDGFRRNTSMGGLVTRVFANQFAHNVAVTHLATPGPRCLSLPERVGARCRAAPGGLDMRYRRG
jgi:hypothetical protein